MKQFVEWCSKHPLVWGMCAMSVGLLGSLLGQSLDENQPWIPYVGCLFVVWVVMSVHMSRTISRKALTVVTLLSFISGLNPLGAAESPRDSSVKFEPNKEVGFVGIPLQLEPRAFPFVEEIPYLVGGLVIVGGTGTVIYLYRLCKRVFNTNAPAAPPNPSPDVANGGDENTYAMSVTYSGRGYCYEGAGGGGPEDLPLKPILTQVELVTEDTIWGTEVYIVGVRRVPESGCSNNPEDYLRFASSLGLNFQPDVAGQSFGVNGEPATSNRVPMSFDQRTKTFSLWGGCEVNFTLQRSSDFTQWVDLVTFTSPGGHQISIEDETEGRQVFYRMKTVMP